MGGGGGDGSSWGGPNGANAREFRSQASVESSVSAAAKQNPFQSGNKSGPPVFYRSKTQPDPSGDPEQQNNNRAQPRPPMQ